MNNIDEIIVKEYQIYVERFNNYYDDKSENNYLMVKESESKLKELYALKKGCELSQSINFMIGFAGFLSELNSQYK